MSAAVIGRCARTEPDPHAHKACGCGRTIRVHAVACPECLRKLPQSILIPLAAFTAHGLAWTAHAGWQTVYDTAMRALQRLRRPPPPPAQPWAEKRNRRGD